MPFICRTMRSSCNLLYRNVAGRGFMGRDEALDDPLRATPLEIAASYLASGGYAWIQEF